jgi:hypothetical protein
MNRKKKKVNSYTLNKMGYEACKNWAQNFYKNIGSILSPALDNQPVSFNNTGFNHLIRKLSVRSRNEQKRRFLLLPKVESIITNPEAVIVYRKKLNVHYWTFIHHVDSKRIKVVIRQVNNGSKHFYSVMDKKINKKVEQQKTRL